MKLILIDSIYYFGMILRGLIFVRVITSWFIINRKNAFFMLPYTLTEPLISPVRFILRKIFPSMQYMMVDFSTLIVYLLIGFIRDFLIRIISVYF